MWRNWWTPPPSGGGGFGRAGSSPSNPHPSGSAARSSVGQRTPSSGEDPTDALDLLVQSLRPADVAELADAPALGAGGLWPWGFESLHPHRASRSLARPPSLGPAWCNVRMLAAESAHGGVGMRVVGRVGCGALVGVAMCGDARHERHRGGSAAAGAADTSHAALQPGGARGGGSRRGFQHRRRASRAGTATPERSPTGSTPTVTRASPSASKTAPPGT